MELQTDYLARLQAALEGEPRLELAWLSGSFGRGDADRYSDIDLNLLLDPAHFAEFQSEAEAWLAGVRPLVLFTWMFGGRMANCLTVDGLRLDVWLHSERPLSLDKNRVRPLLERVDALRLEEPSEPTRSMTGDQLLQQINEFWRCIALAPAAVGRGENITSFFGLGLEATILADVLIAGSGVQRDRGIKRTNSFLSEPLRLEIEEALTFDGLSAGAMARAALALARIMQREGPAAAERWRVEYPVDLEAAVLSYVIAEFAAGERG
jgi:hypothetical protein